MSEVTDLYRHFNLEGELLYVGISINAFERYKQHAIEKDWFDSVINMTVERFSTRQQALEAEKAAIKAEKPKYNVVHNPIAPKQRVKKESPKAVKSYISSEMAKAVKFERINCAFPSVSASANFIVGEEYVYYQRSGWYRSCDVFKVLLIIDDDVIQIKFKDGKTKLRVVTRNFVDSVEKYTEEVWSTKDTKFDGIVDVKKSIEELGIDPFQYYGSSATSIKFVGICLCCGNNYVDFMPSILEGSHICEECSDRRGDKNFKKIKKRNGDSVTVWGKWHLAFAMWLEENGHTWEYSKGSFEIIRHDLYSWYAQESKYHKSFKDYYAPSFYVEGLGFFEVNGIWEYDNYVKFQHFMHQYPEQKITLVQKEDIFKLLDE